MRGAQGEAPGVYPFRDVSRQPGLVIGSWVGRAMTQPPLTVRRWKRAEYEQLVDLGVFQGDSVELIGGQLVVAEPQGAYHASAVTRVDYALRTVLPGGWIVRIQAPVSIDDDSEPEPDLVVDPGRPGAYQDSPPATSAFASDVCES